MPKDRNIGATFHAPIAETVWNDKYRLKTALGEPVDLVVEDTWRRVANALAAPEEDYDDSLLPGPDYARDFYDALEDWKFLPAGRITAGAGTSRTVTLFNCFVMGTIPDSMNGIFEMLKEAALTMQQGGGIGYDFSPIRPKTSWVKGVDSEASGPLSFMDCWDAMCRTVMSAGSRRGAMMATMRCDHPDIEDFITAKHDARRLRMFNLSVLVTDAFMEAVKADAGWALIHSAQPAAKHEVQYVGVRKAEIPKGVQGHVHKVVRARALWDTILRSTYDYAEPGVIFIDRVNKRNNLRYCETITASNPCGEQMLPPYGACLLGSINLAALVENPYEANAGIGLDRLRPLVARSIRMLDNVCDVSKLPLQAQADEVQAKRRVGLGVTGVADALMMCGLTYGTPAAAKRLKEWMREVALAAYEASIDLAKEKGPFPLFDADEFLAEGTFAGDMLPVGMQDDIREHGIRNALLTSIAPTGTISLYAGNVSSGIEPVFASSYVRKVLQPDGSKIEERVVDYAVALWESMAQEKRATHKLPKDSPWLNGLPPCYVDAQTLSPAEHVLMQAAAQEWVDNSISKTINCPEDITFDEFKAVYELAYESGLKGCTTYRPNDVTGSVLSVEPKKPEPVVLDESHHLKEPETLGITAEMENGPGRLYPHQQAVFDAMVAPYGLSKRPDVLPGAVHKIKLGDGHALYVTITDIEDAGGRRPFEIFISTKDPEHFEWTTALTRMISAVFRRPHDSTFVVEELKAVFSPKGGGFWRGAYRNSTVAAIGQVIEDHMKSIGYGPYREAPPAAPLVPEDYVSPGYPVSPPVPNETRVSYGGPSCPKCHGHNLKNESGCLACLDCGHSKCG